MKIEAGGLKRILAKATVPQVEVGAQLQPTCVFLLLFEKNGPHILAIQKSNTEGYPWRNQVALPGGHVDQEDAGPLAAAFRELKEEVNISSEQIDLIGSLGHFQTINQKGIEVFVGIWDGSGPVCCDTCEIARTLEIPLADLLATHMQAGFHGRQPDVDELRYPFQDVVVWGATARILHFFIELLYPLWEADGTLAGFRCGT